ncbi:MAG: dihydroneopterin aldolase [Mucilaginibacter sp.]|nr:dihydroneopterin aldolase [Mucilaginibacter sp.]
MVNVALEGAEFFAYHGFYPEEQLLGTRFFVDVKVSFNTKNALNDDKIDNTVNYEVLYSIVQTEMEHPRKLIETVVQAIIDKVVNNFPFISEVVVTIKKMNPPFNGPVKNSAVTISYLKD